MKQIISTPNAPQAIGPYSQANIATGRAIYVAGQLALDPASGKPVSGDIEAQTTRVFDNIAAILQASGSSFKDVVKVNVYLSDVAHFAKMNEVYRRYFASDYPARTTIQAVLPPGFLLEADAVAYIG
jgi:reactive intermediate/imine deaminase